MNLISIRMKIVNIELTTRAYVPSTSGYHMLGVDTRYIVRVWARGI